MQYTIKSLEPCFVFQIPPQSSTSGHRADTWPTEPSWNGKMDIVVNEDVLKLNLVDSTTGKLFGACPIERNGIRAVQKVTDSSRYFVLRLVDEASGRHAFVGIAFESRDDAFEFNVTIGDHIKQVKRMEQVQVETSMDYSIKEGQKMKIKMPRKKVQSGKMQTDGLQAPPEKNVQNAGLQAPPKKNVQSAPDEWVAFS